jgi:hypothetical protein
MIDAVASVERENMDLKKKVMALESHLKNGEEEKKRRQLLSIPAYIPSLRNGLSSSPSRKGQSSPPSQNGLSTPVGSYVSKAVSQIESRSPYQLK